MNAQMITFFWLLLGIVSLSLPAGECKIVRVENEGHMAQYAGDPFDKVIQDNLPSPVTPSLPRRISAAARAISSRRQSFGEIGELPPRPRLVSYPATSTPTGSRPHFDTGPSPASTTTGDASLLSSASGSDSFVTPQQSPQRPSTTPPTGSPAPTQDLPGPVLEPSETTQTGGVEPDPATDTEDSPKFNRSGKKRRLTQGSGARKLSKKMNEGKKSTTKDAEDPLAKLARMIKGLEDKIQESEVRTATKIESKIDSLAATMGARLDKTEEQLVTLNVNMAQAQADIEDVRELASADNIKRLVEEAMKPNSERDTPGGGRRPRGFRERGTSRDERQNGGPEQDPGTAEEERYWRARKQLRVWPILPTADLDSGVRAFLRDRLMMQAGRIDQLDFTVSAISTRQDSPAQNQALVTFSSVRERDEVRSKANNLKAGDKTAGCQLEPPDHLRGHYKAFQNLAFCMKKKTPGLKRNIKFEDYERTLVMDVKMDDTWKTVHYATAKGLLKLKTQGSDALSRRQLKDFLSNSDVIQSDDSSDDVTMTEEKNRSNCKAYPHSINFINTNARSLGPKMESLADCFTEKHLDLATVTETWFQTSRERDLLEEELSSRYSLGMFTRERGRAASNGRQYGGVALVYRLRTTKLERFTLSNPSNFEVLAAVGRITGVKGKIFILACYAPPNMPNSEAKALIEYLSDVVCEAKRTYRDCSILVKGDFNQWSVEELLEEHPDLSEIIHGPTRGTKSIDRSFCNFGRSIKESGTLPPLETEDGRTSDHRIAYAVAAFDSPPDETITYTHRPYTERGAAIFLERLERESWEDVLAAPDVNAKTELFQNTIDELFNSAFPLKTVKKRKSDPPWVNETIRRMSVKRRRIYNREGRSKRWKSLKKKTDALYRLRASNYFETQKKTLTGPDACRAFYRNVKAYRAREKPPDFDVCSLFPGESKVDVAEKLAEHFNKISKEFDGLTPDQIPTAHSAPLPNITVEEVRDKLVSFRKPKSRVPGDIFPTLVDRAAPALAVPLSSIYNRIGESGDWPKDWKTEYVTPTPKTNLPSSPSDLRNISCTKLFSKVYESFILPQLTTQAKLRTNQYGGVKGMGTEHFLIEFWQRILEDIDDNRAGTLVTSIDYSKAFNRLDFASCLKSLKAKGVSTQLLRIVASFLTGRNMTVRVGEYFSTLRTVEGGVPQGSLLGVFLFNVTIDAFEAFSADVANYGPVPEDVLAPDPGTLPPEPQHLPPMNERDYKHMAIFKEELLRVQKYIDDNIICEKINFDKIGTDGYSFRDYLATRTQTLFRHIVARAEHCGMKVNALKTHAMVVAETKSYIPKAHFFDSEGVKVESKSKMKILGVHFSSDPDMAAQVESIKSKFRTRMWILRHLGHHGFDADDLLKVYKSVILPCHDYCSVVYHSSLTNTQSDALERLQAQALKCIYGYDYSYRALLEMSRLTSLSTRRENRCTKFAEKCLSNDRLKSWFPLQENPRAVRSRNKFKEFGAKTNRLLNSPLYHLRRRLNAVHRQ